MTSRNPSPGRNFPSQTHETKTIDKMQMPKPAFQESSPKLFRRQRPDQPRIGSDCYRPAKPRLLSGTVTIPSLDHSCLPAFHSLPPFSHPLYSTSTALARAKQESLATDGRGHDAAGIHCRTLRGPVLHRAVANSLHFGTRVGANFAKNVDDVRFWKIFLLRELSKLLWLCVT